MQALRNIKYTLRKYFVPMLMSLVGLILAFSALQALRNIKYTLRKYFVPMLMSLVGLILAFSA